MRLASLVLFALAACASAQEVTPPPQDHPLSWISGCWITEDGSYKEVWSQPEAGHLFGYALTYRDGNAVFFEQTHIAPGDLYVFNAYPAGKGPTKFPESIVGEQSVVFENSAHDFPQLISYSREGNRLNAYIALSDGSQRGDFAFVPCPD